MSSSTRRLILIIFCGFLFLLDRWLKWQARNAWSESHLLTRWFGWHPFLNPGVAFGVPLPSAVVVAFTFPVLVVLAYFIVERWRQAATILSYVSRDDTGAMSLARRYRIQAASFLLILTGALSNLIDRVMYAHTVDYILIVTAVINVADVMIVMGFVIYFWYQRNTKTAQQRNTC